MKLIRGVARAPKFSDGCVVTLGNYDGVHQGHQAVLASLRQQAESMGLPLVVVCFEPTPREFFKLETAPARLTNLREKAQLLAALGVNYMLVQRFDAAFASLSAEGFVEQFLRQGLHAKAVVVGDDFRFGAARQGDVELLRQLSVSKGFEVLDTTTVEADQQRISSTMVRDCLKKGDLAYAARLLGRPYSIEGRVMHGDKLGRQLGFPTANIRLNRVKAPVAGVFTVKVHGVEDTPLNGVANVGTRPAVNGVEERLEVYLLDWQGDLYGQRLRVEFVNYIRPEKRFDGLEALTAAIAADVAKARQLLA